MSYFILDFLQFSEMCFSFSMVPKYFLYVALVAQQITKYTMKNSSPLPTLLHIESKHFQLFVIFFAFIFLNNMHGQIFPYYYFFLNQALYRFASAADENSAFLPYLFASHPPISLSFSVLPVQLYNNILAKFIAHPYNILW